MFRHYAILKSMRALAKTVFAFYILTLLWLVLFKFSYDFASVLGMQTHSVNLVPFADFSRTNAREMFYNFAVFIPFGLLLSANLKQAELWQKLMYIFFFSLGVETVQFMLGIGITDIADIITNTTGGLIGLIIYAVGRRFIDHEKLDKFIVILGLVLLVLFILARTLLLHVRYH